MVEMGDSLRHHGQDAFDRSIRWQGVERTLRIVDGAAIVPVPEMAGRMPEQDQSFTQAIPSGRPNFLRDAEDLTPLGPATRAPVRPGQPEGQERGSRKDVGWHPLQPGPQRHDVIVFEKLSADHLEHGDGMRPISTSSRVANSILEIAISLKPSRSPPVQVPD